MAKTKTTILDFTIKNIEALPPATVRERDEYRDKKVQGLYLRVTRRGVKSFSVVGRPKGGGLPERETLGKFPMVKPEEARQRARELGGQLATGKSVTAARRARKGEYTVSELWTSYYAHITATNKAPEATKTIWDLHIAPVFGRRRLSEVQAVDVERWHRELPAKIMKRRADEAAARATAQAARRAEIDARQAIRRHGPAPKPRPDPAQVRKPAKQVTGQGSANKALETLRAMFFYAMKPIRGLFAGPNPASGHQKFKQFDRERFIHPDEMPAFFGAVAEETNETMRDAILVKLMVGQRKGNVLAMRWDEVNLDRAEWRVAGAFTKNGDNLVVPLTPEVVAIIRNRKEKADLEAAARRASKVVKVRLCDQFVFPSERSETGHITDIKSAWRRLMKRAGLPNLVPHDLRRTFGSWQARNGSSLLIIGKSLAHKDPQATEIYAQLDLDPVRASVEGATASMLEAGGVKVAAQVVQLRASRDSNKAKEATGGA